MSNGDAAIPRVSKPMDSRVRMTDRRGKNMREKTRVRRMFVLDGGSFLYETGMMVFGKVGETHQRVFTPIYAFETEEGWVLYDTGWPPEAIPMLVDLGMDPKIGDENSAVGQLKKIGVEPSEVTKIILSHLHHEYDFFTEEIEIAKAFE